jgi:hypothetical protein
MKVTCDSEAQSFAILTAQIFGSRMNSIEGMAAIDTVKKVVTLSDNALTLRSSTPGDAIDTFLTMTAKTSSNAADLERRPLHSVDPARRRRRDQR